MATCLGNSEDHCCYLRGQVCQFLEENTIPGRRWVCKLRRELGSWDRVHNDPRYIKEVKETMRGIAGVDCGDWPRFGETCEECGITGGTTIRSGDTVDNIYTTGVSRAKINTTLSTDRVCDG